MKDIMIAIVVLFALYVAFIALTKLWCIVSFKRDANGFIDEIADELFNKMEKDFNKTMNE